MRYTNPVSNESAPFKPPPCSILSCKFPPPSAYDTCMTTPSVQQVAVDFAHMSFGEVDYSQIHPALQQIHTHSTFELCL